MACFAWVAAPGWGAETDAPLAVTILAQGGPRVTPSYSQSQLSRAYEQSGMAMLRQGDAQRAIQDFNDSVRLAPTAENFKALGTAYYQAGNHLKAAWAYRESLRLASDTRVQDLVDSLAGEDAGGNQTRYGRLLGRAPAEAQAGRVDQALQDYRDAFSIKPGPESASPGLRLAADSVEGFLNQGALAQAIEVLWRVDVIRRSPGLGVDADLAGPLGRLDKAEARLLRWTGHSLADHQKRMLVDPAAWNLGLRENAAAGEAGR